MMTDSKPRMPSEEPLGYEIVDGIEYNTTPERSLKKLSPEDQKLWLAMVDDMEREAHERIAERDRGN